MELTFPHDHYRSWGPNELRDDVQHRLNFLPLPYGQGPLRPNLRAASIMVMT
jgi:hypothetical protein